LTDPAGARIRFRLPEGSEGKFPAVLSNPEGGRAIP
jgi:hypothetical protein